MPIGLRGSSREVLQTRYTTYNVFQNNGRTETMAKPPGASPTSAKDRGVIRARSGTLDIPFEIWVPAVYAAIAGLWIYFSDHLVEISARTPERITEWSTYKGWFYVAFTASLLCLTLRRIFTGIRQTQQELEDKESDLKRLNETLEQRVAERTALAEHRAAQLRALALQLTQAEQKERRRVAYVLHEHFQQLLVAIRFNAELLRRHPDRPVDGPLQQIESALCEAIRVSRSLTVELSPPILYDVGLAQAMDWLGRWMQERHGLQVKAAIDPAAEPAEEDLRVMLFHATRELLLNVVKHAGVKSARLDMTREGNLLRIVVADEGVGFDPSDRLRRQDSATGYGLFSIRERIEQLGGHLEIDSSPGCGVRTSLTVPIDSAIGAT